MIVHNNFQISGIKLLQNNVLNREKIMIQQVQSLVFKCIHHVHQVVQLVQDLDFFDVWRVLKKREATSR
jgi:hypothetical protein